MKKFKIVPIITVLIFQTSCYQTNENINQDFKADFMSLTRAFDSFEYNSRLRLLETIVENHNSDTLGITNSIIELYDIIWKGLAFGMNHSEGYNFETGEIEKGYEKDVVYILDQTNLVRKVEDHVNKMKQNELFKKSAMYKAVVECLFKDTFYIRSFLKNGNLEEMTNAELSFMLLSVEYRILTTEIVFFETYYRKEDFGEKDLRLKY
tara:strand:+ start:117 stop:740 length:624 start_codon:yes stop_codon:yes gene_type:complete